MWHTWTHTHTHTSGVCDSLSAWKFLVLAESHLQIYRDGFEHQKTVRTELLVCTLTMDECGTRRVSTLSVNIWGEGTGISHGGGLTPNSAPSTGCPL